jgi:hypothetical protein
MTPPVTNIRYDMVSLDLTNTRHPKLWEIASIVSRQILETTIRQSPKIKPSPIRLLNSQPLIFRKEKQK